METGKQCISCWEPKLLSEFPLDASRRDGRLPYCRKCLNAKHRARYWSDPEAGRASSKAKAARYRKANRPKVLAAKRSYYAAHADQCIAALKRRDTPDKVAARARARRATALKAIPAWSNKFFVAEAYHLAGIRTKNTGIQWHVDHLVPLKHRAVCGLHWEGNLAVISAKSNMQKGNRHWPGM